MVEQYYCRHCEHQYETDEWERAEGDPPAEQCPHCNSQDTTCDPDQFPEPDHKTYERENPR